MRGFKSLSTFWVEELDSEGFVDSPFANFGGGGKGGGDSVQTPVFVPPPVAPSISEAATQESAVTPEEEAKRKKEATKSGAKSLQIPTTGTTGSDTRTVGTGA